MQKTGKIAPEHQFISFFSGARGLDLGLEAAGLTCIATNEWDEAACETIRLNEPSLPLYQGDIRQIKAASLMRDLKIDPGELFAIVGGPPCQAFSTAGRRLGLNDQRGNVFLHFLELITSLRPKYAVFENVRGLLSAPLLHRPHQDRGAGYPELSEDEMPGGALGLILRVLEEAGYRTTFNLYNTANFGVPQSRERMIFFASRDGAAVPDLRPTHSRNGDHGLPGWRTFREATSHMLRTRHQYLQFPKKRLEFYKFLSEGQNWRNLPSEIRAEAMGNSFNSGGGRTGFFRRLAWDKPSPTLLTKPNMKATDLCHPDELRPLSIQEYMALQTFPRDYRLAGTLDDQYRQIGNAVPCEFAKKIGEHLIAFENGLLQDQHLGGAPLSRYRRTRHDTWAKSCLDLFADLSVSQENEGDTIQA